MIRPGAVEKRENRGDWPPTQTMSLTAELRIHRIAKHADIVQAATMAAILSLSSMAPFDSTGHLVC
jgi:hypothetical protein